MTRTALLDLSQQFHLKMHFLECGIFKFQSTRAERILLYFIYAPGFIILTKHLNFHGTDSAIVVCIYCISIFCRNHSKCKARCFFDVVIS